MVVQLKPTTIWILMQCLKLSFVVSWYHRRNSYSIPYGSGVWSPKESQSYTEHLPYALDRPPENNLKPKEKDLLPKYGSSAWNKPLGKISPTYIIYSCS